MQSETAEHRSSNLITVDNIHHMIMKKRKRLRAVLLILLLCLIYLNRESLNPFTPDCSAQLPKSALPAACRKPVKEVAPGFEL
ncbi:hypothetical protein [Dickeya zeae]|uniref:hypothetical protein n=1 Tax=Dickeya zeae TaxID=204042 RepID=UPI001CF52603|nr:hypothetical protein [Dickeya zeae]MCA6987251.1 hypothetical protein [Dickeya zeae]